MAASYRFVVEDSKRDVEVSEIMDGGLLGVNGILDDTALGSGGRVVGFGGMVEVTARWWDWFVAAVSSRGSDVNILA